MLNEEKKQLLNDLLTKLYSLSDKAIDILYNKLVNKEIFYSKDEVFEYYANNRESIKAIIENAYDDLIADIFDYALLAKEIYPLTFLDFIFKLKDKYLKFFLSYVALYDRKLVIISTIMTIVEFDDQALESLMKNIP